MKILTILGVAILAATTLAACGGGGSSSVGNTNTTPTTVTQTPGTPAANTDSGLIIDNGRGISNN